MKIRTWIQQWSGPVALLLVLTGGSAYALDGTNTVFSDDIVNGEVRTTDIRDGHVTAPDLGANSVRTGKVLDDNLTGSDVANDTIGTFDVSGLQGADITESTLDQVPSALIGGLGRQGSEVSCDPESEVFETCGTVNVNTSAPTRALLIGRVASSAEFGAQDGVGKCRLGSSSVGPLLSTTISMKVPSIVHPEHSTLIGVTPPLVPGAHSFGIDCNQDESEGAIVYPETAISALMISRN